MMSSYFGFEVMSLGFAASSLLYTWYINFALTHFKPGCLK